MKSKIIMLIVLLISCLNAVAQRLSTSDNIDETTVPVLELDAFLSPPSQTARAAGVSNVTLLNMQNVKELVYNTQPSIYFFGGVVKVFGDKPRNLFTDANSISSLNNSVTLKNNIEIVTVNLDNPNQLNTPINLSQLSEFKNLKYIYFITSFDVSNNAIANLIQGDSEKYMVFYKVQKGDNN
ncbi:hypothetical protein GCM10022386_24960 [Flavobacterium cheonhonense]|jgi:PBP1b-binding outer membrane lipoprotein LpoB|uniref:Uncharacterized protein n=1 Tax=Flavobacterium cheonhonense TaxID=706185 RepID=A0ABP7U8Y5_9FLAO|nr:MULTISPECIES: hypothetical protein [Flavobacterium]